MLEMLEEDGPVTSTGPSGVGAGLQPNGTTTGNKGDGSAISGYDKRLRFRRLKKKRRK